MNAARQPRDLPASIRQRLLDLSRERGEDFQAILDRYAVERMLYRLSVSDQRREFLLKGALLFAVWFDAPHRPTRDADLLGFGEPDAERLDKFVRKLCAMPIEDGMTYEAASVRVQEIREQAAYPGLRVNLRGTLGNARCNVQLDVGFGDAVTPEPIEEDYPNLLDDLPSPRLRVYPRESVYAEKVEAIARFGIANSRMKDYFDLLALTREGAMDPAVLARAVAATFERRRTPIPDAMPLGLTAEFAADAAKRRQWSAFLGRSRLEAPTLEATIEELARFLRAPLQAARASKEKRKKP
ncbi:MAG TPA: nucleotidyl transferase AbiEii/AbiGii toxin family protein [Burkholderiales bacterium]|nr:nucleotidyl transferase AbiEii/AbiGii toxin family protein [Burkholderiales bacterium]